MYDRKEEMKGTLDYNFPVFRLIIRMPSSLSLRSLRIFDEGRHVCERHGVESANIRSAREEGAETYIVSLLQRYELVPEQLPHLRILDDPSKRPGREVRVATVARVEADGERGRGRHRVKVCRRFGEGGDFEVVTDGEPGGEANVSSEKDGGEQKVRT